jgi:hypothetical protein
LKQAAIWNLWRRADKKIGSLVDGVSSFVLRLRHHCYIRSATRDDRHSRANHRFAGKTIVVVWHHGNIPEFAQYLHAKDGTYPDKWKGHVFNQFLEFDYAGKHHPSVNMVTEPF